MKLIIEIPLDLYERCKRGDYELFDDSARIMVIANGVPYNPSGDCISRSEIRKAIEKFPNANPSYWNKCDVVDRQDVLDEIDNAPPISERQKGEWVCKTKSTFPQYQPDEFECSSCKQVSTQKYSFCPNCGADMRGEEE